LALREQRNAAGIAIAGRRDSQGTYVRQMIRPRSLSSDADWRVIGGSGFNEAHRHMRASNCVLL
jgi:hypothetical protein